MSKGTIIKKVRKRRLSNTPRMVCVSVRLPVEVAKWYQERYAFNYTTNMRGVLLAHAELKGMKEPSPTLDTVKE